MLARKRKGDIKEFVVANVLERPAGRSSFTDLGRTWSARAFTWRSGPKKPVTRRKTAKC
ncbi:hypothetical protein [Deinococcus cavernae]|uniref:hypothetical protein n=1 Tax=Deinococcus cavernae TaxID=2320857 RepID=UPI001F18D5D5|nr:hypothetical protein [Deinococcus cavernae]